MNLRLPRIILYLMGFLIILGMVAVEWKKSLGVWESARFNLLYVDNNGTRVSVVSFDPVEQKVLMLEYPGTLSINTRSVGEYKISNLYTLGKYKQQGGEFARRKVQGFMRMPITGYLVDQSHNESVARGLSRGLLKGMWRRSETNLSRIDQYILWQQLRRYNASEVGEDELLRAGIIVKQSTGEGYGYMAERLSQYVGKQFFDWGVGIEGATVAVINESGIDGLGNDMAGFLTNMGLDVVVVRSGGSERSSTKIEAANLEKHAQSLRLIDRAFGFGRPNSGKTDEYRADIVVWVGSDAKELF